MEWYKQHYYGTRNSNNDLEEQGFKFNPYDPCVANRMIKGSQHTILFHVDDLKCSHKKKTVNDEFAKWLEETYGQHGKMKIHCGKVHDYLGMKLDYSEKKKIKIYMRDYVKGMLDSFPIKFKECETATTPAGEDLFGQNQGMTRNYNKTRLKHFIQQWLKDYFLLREEGQIYIQELHFYVQEYNNLMKKIGKSLLD